MKTPQAKADAIAFTFLGSGGTAVLIDFAEGILAFAILAMSAVLAYYRLRIAIDERRLQKRAMKQVEEKDEPQTSYTEK